MPKLLLVSMGVLAALSAAAVALSLWSWKRPATGLVDGRLRPCPPSDNCVSTTEEGSAGMEPISYGVGVESHVAWSRLERIVLEHPRAKIIVRDGDYIHAEFVSPIFRFVDDVEFLHDPAERRIHFRSASRVGRSDLGANRSRMERIVKAFEDAR